VYSVAQALACASIGVQYIAPYLGRMRDAGIDGDAVIARMQEVCAGSGTNVLAASLRSADDITGLRLAGVPYFTAAPDVIEQVMFHEVSVSSAAEFDAAMGRLGA
jgi:transaldolase